MIRISVSKISKKFDLDAAYNDGALAKLRNLLLNRGGKRERHALQNVSFEANSGEVVGLIGRNGCGKTTLLRLIGGIYSPDEGTIQTNGTVVYLAGFGQGLIPKLSMRENIELIGVMRGLSIRDVKEEFDEIVEFSGLRDYTDIKIYQFSPGMLSRLAFSATIHSLEKYKPDILLIDEVLGSSGDIEFEEKAALKLNEFIHNRAAVVLATHDMSLVKKLCQRAVLLENGNIQENGNPQDVVSSYLASYAKVKTVSAN